jgi:hypothetical protein
MQIPCSLFLFLVPYSYSLFLILYSLVFPNSPIFALIKSPYGTTPQADNQGFMG